MHGMIDLLARGAARPWGTGHRDVRAKGWKAMRGTPPDTVSFSHVVLEGTPYQVGRMQAEMLREDPQRRAYLTPTLPFLDRYNDEEAARELAFLERYCPGLREEVQGAADALGVSPADIAFLGGKPKVGGQCSHFAVFPYAAADGHLRLGQNEDCGPGDLDPSFGRTGVVTTSVGLWAQTWSLALQPDGEPVVVGMSASPFYTDLLTDTL